MIDSRIHRLAISLGGALLLAASSALADSAAFEKGASAYKRGDYDTALAVFRPLAENGDTRAQSILALMYVYGEGVPTDYREAARWYRRAADQNSNVAQYNLGMLYLEGKGVEQDTDQAILWLTKAADGGHFRARQELAKLDAGSYSSLTSTSSESLEAPPSTTAPQAPPPSVVMRKPAPQDRDPHSPPPTAAELMKVNVAGASSRAQTNGETPARRQAGSLAFASAQANGQNGHSGTDRSVAKPRTAQSSPRSDRMYRVQLAASRSEENIRRDWMRYRQRYADIFEGLNGRVERAELGEDKTVWYRLRVGPFETEASAKALCEKLDARGADTGCLPLRAIR